MRALTRYFAEGATTWDFRTRLFVANPGTTPANVQLRFLRSDGVVHTHALAVAPMARQVVDVGSLVDMEAAEFSTMIESDALVVADRVVDWPRDNPSGGPYGSHAEPAVTAPAISITSPGKFGASKLNFSACKRLLAPAQSLR